MTELNIYDMLIQLGTQRNTIHQSVTLTGNRCRRRLVACFIQLMGLCQRHRFLWNTNCFI